MTTGLDNQSIKDSNHSTIASVFRFPPFRTILGAAGQILGQSMIYWVLFSLTFIVWVINPATWGNDQVLLALREITKLLAFTISVFIATKVLAGRDLVDLGLRLDRWTLYDFLVGLLISFLLAGVYFFARLIFGEIKIVGFAWQTSTSSFVIGNLLITFLIFSFVGWSEELLSRGFHLQTISKGLNQFWGVVISCTIFVYLHRFNSDFDLYYIIFLFAGGLFFSYAYLKTRQLWLSIGLHAGWDYFMVVIFFGWPIGDLRIFRLMDVQILSSSDLVHLVAILLLLLAGGKLIQRYSKFRRQRVNPAT